MRPVRLVFVGRGRKLEMGRGLELEGFELVSARGSVLGRGLAEPHVEAARRGEKPHP